MGGLTPSPEDAHQQDDAADDLTSTTHSLKTIPAGSPRAIG